MSSEVERLPVLRFAHTPIDRYYMSCIRAMSAPAKCQSCHVGASLEQHHLEDRDWVINATRTWPIYHTSMLNGLNCSTRNVLNQMTNAQTPFSSSSLNRRFRSSSSNWCFHLEKQPPERVIFAGYIRYWIPSVEMAFRSCQNMDISNWIPIALHQMTWNSRRNNDEAGRMHPYSI